MNKIEIEQIKNIEKYIKQGASWCSIYEGIYDGEKVIIKSQNIGSLKKTNFSDDRFEIEKNILEKKLNGMVKCYGYGDNFNNERFFVLEKLYDLPDKLDRNLLQKISDTVLSVPRKLYLNEINWNCTKTHILQDKNGNIKLIDFNDDNYKRNNFLKKDEIYDYLGFLKKIIKENNELNEEEIINLSLKKIVTEEYQSLDNVHQPIYFKEYREILKTERDKNDQNFGKLVYANRNCWDRSKIILDSIDVENKTILDIGTNVGWFCFNLEDNGAITKGVDFDKDKISFNILLSEIFNRKSIFEYKNVNIEYLNSISKYDIIIALSILHLYFTQHKVTKEYWEKLFKKICEKCNKYFIYEVSSDVFEVLNVGDYNDMAKYSKKIGNFKKAEIIGQSVEGRFLILCEK